jgi:hypothetical protein
VECYKQNTKEADLYYDCFHRAELQLAEDNNNFSQNYQILEDEYKICEKNCADSYHN